jgi:hypothetical protein
MAASDQATEVFRFATARPAKKDLRSIKISRVSVAASLQSDLSTDELPFVVSVRKLKYSENIRDLEQRLKLESGNLTIGLNTKLDAELVRNGIKRAFPNQNLGQLVEKEDWVRDERQLDRALVGLYDAASDGEAIGPQATRWRQLYELVRQAVDPDIGKDGKEPFLLKGLELVESVHDNSTITTSRHEEGRPGIREELTLRPEFTAITARSKADKAKELKIRNLVEGLKFLNSPTFFELRQVNKAIPGQFLVFSHWPNHLPEGPREALKSIGIGSGNDVLQTIRFYYNAILNAIRETASPPVDAPREFRGGIFSIGPFNVEMTKPWTWTAGADAPTSPDERDTPEPTTRTKSVIKPTGVADLMVVRDHVFKYVGGDVGAIQNVLKSEEMVHETKRLERTELVEFESSETITEDEREQSTSTRFALTKEANDVIKKDTAMKAGVSTTVYGKNKSFFLTFNLMSFVKY